MTLYIVEMLDEDRGNWIPLLHIQPVTDNAHAWEKLQRQEKLYDHKKQFRVSAYRRV